MDIAIQDKINHFDKSTIIQCLNLRKKNCRHKILEIEKKEISDDDKIEIELLKSEINDIDEAIRKMHIAYPF